MFFRSSLAALLLLSWAAPLRAQADACLDKLVVEQVLHQLNALRADPRACGQQAHGPAGPLRWELRLEQVAQRHAAELAQGDQLNHLGAGGRSLRERLRANGYIAFRVGENLAAGQESVDEVLQTWSGSAKHCENLMQAEFQDVGLACASGPGKYSRYWVMNLGRPVRD